MSQIAHPQLPRMGLDSGSRSQDQPDCCQSLPESGPIQETIAAANRNVARISQNLAESWLSEFWLDCGIPESGQNHATVWSARFWSGIQNGTVSVATLDPQSGYSRQWYRIKPPYTDTGLHVTYDLHKAPVGYVCWWIKANNKFIIGRGNTPALKSSKL